MGIVFEILFVSGMGDIGIQGGLLQGPQDMAMGQY